MAHFKTGKDQYIVVVDAKVSTTLTVGDLVIFTAGNPNTVAASSNGLTTATHIVALSDEAVGGNYVPTDKKDYAPSNTVASSTTAKKVALYPLFDKADVIV